MTTDTLPYFKELGFTEYMSICIDAASENYLDLYTKPMTGAFAGALLCVEPVTRMLLIVKLSDKGVDCADFVGGLPRSVDDAKRLIASLNDELMAFRVSDSSVCDHEFVAREYLSQPYGTCLGCGQTIFSN